MGKRTEWKQADIDEYVKSAHGCLTLAAQCMNKDRGERQKVSRQNLQTWVNAAPAGASDSMDNFELARKLRHQQNRNLSLARELRNLNDAVITKSDTLQSIAQAVTAADLPLIPMGIQPYNGGKKITIEVLFSDIQIGKLMDDYNTAVAWKRLNEWLEVTMARINQYELLGYHVERIVFSCLGDVIESDKKHSNSARACDIGTADQMRIGIEMMFKALNNLASFGAPVDAVMITGNHDHDDHGLNMFMPGREHLSWPMYHAVRMMCEQAGMDVTFFIPEGSFYIYELYGQRVLYEHGVRVATSEVAMKKHVSSRMNQIKGYIDMFRMGDKHNICRFNNDRYVVNGAFFGDSRKGEEYSGIAGYDGEPAQLMFAHVNRSDNFRTSIFDSLAIQLGHIK